jgi:type II secretion system protein G
MKYISQRKTAGFTLVELMTVITIIGILMALVLTTLFQARKEARDRTRGSELEQLKLSLKLYKEAEGDYPSYDDGVRVTDSAFVSSLEPYTAEAYADPLNTDPYTYWYDSHFECGGDDYTVVGAQSLEVEGNTNFSKECIPPGSPSTTEVPLSDANNSYIILVRKNPIP